MLSIGQRRVLNDAQIPDFDPACSGGAGGVLGLGGPGTGLSAVRLGRPARAGSDLAGLSDLPTRCWRGRVKDRSRGP